MIRHIVILHFKKSASQDYPALMDKTRPLLECIPGIISYDIYVNHSKYVSKDVCSLGVEIMFKDQRALDLFMKHPKHYEANAIFERYLADPPYMVLTHDM